MIPTDFCKIWKISFSTQFQRKLWCKQQQQKKSELYKWLDTRIFWCLGDEFELNKISFYFEWSRSSWVKLFQAATKKIY